MYSCSCGYRTGEQIAPKNLFPSIEQVHTLPARLETNDFDKCDFRKN